MAQVYGWSVSKLAKFSGVSMRTLERHFQKHFGKKPKTWLSEQRLKQAIELLHSGSSVKEVAEALGFKNQHHFSREFKKFNNYAPSQFLI